MSNKKQTAVEFLESQYKFHGELYETAIEQAKEMEKQQQEYFFRCGRQYQLTGEGTFTEVYNETYEQ